MATTTPDPFDHPPLDVWIDISPYVTTEKENTTFGIIKKFASGRSSDGWMSLVDVSYMFNEILKKISMWQIFSDDGTARNSHEDAILLAKIQKGMITSKGVYVSFR